MNEYTTKDKRRTENSSIKKKTLIVLNPTATGIDIGSRYIHVCAGKDDGSTETREFTTFTADLWAMVDWLKNCNTSSIAMESTGVYWIPVYDILDQAGFDVKLVNAHHLKTVPGRKTDIKDCQWIQQLHSCGLLSGSFRPEGESLTLRGYVRQRSKLNQQTLVQVNLMHKALTQMNLQLHQVISDITGETGMKIIRTIIAGERDPIVLATHRDPRCKKDENTIAKALDGNYRPELVLALQQSVEAYDFFKGQINICEQYIEKTLAGREKQNKNSFEKREKSVKKKSKSSYCFNVRNMLREILGIDIMEVPGIDSNTAMKIISEIGTDMSKWPTEKHFASWLGLCPGNKISGGKVLSSKTKPSSNKAAQAFRIAAQALNNSLSALGAYFRRMRGKFGGPKAITATAHKLAIIFYSMLKNRKSYQDIGQGEYERRHQERNINDLRKKAKTFGFELVAQQA